MNLLVLFITTSLTALLSPVSAWLASEYIEVSLISLGDGGTYTSIGYPTPTAAVTPVSTSTYTQLVVNEQLTILQLVLSGSNLPTVGYSFTPFSATELTSAIFYAPATITAPPTCTRTSFSYVTTIPVDPPTQMLEPPNFPLVTSSTAWNTTTYYLNADGQTTSSTSWSNVEYYLQTGQVLPLIPDDTSAMLGFCQDPRGCYSGIGAGCTAAASETATEVNGPPESVTAKTTAGKGTTSPSGTTSASASASSTKNAAGRVIATGGDGWWVCAVAGVAGWFGAMMIL